MGRADWNSLQYVLAMARHGSLERAARALGVDHSTVSRQIRALERRIRARIFDRTAVGHRLTATGEVMVRSAEEVEAIVAGITRVADGADERAEGLIRIAAPSAMVTRLPPVLARFGADHPLVTFRLGEDISPDALVRHEVDVAIRPTRPPQTQLASRRLFKLGFGLYGGVGYLRSRPLESSRTLAGHDLLGYADRLADLPEAQWMEQRAAGARYVFRSRSMDALLAAAASDFGLAVLPCPMADGDPRLTRLAGPEEVVERDVWLVVHRDLRRVARLRAFVAFLAKELGGLTC